MAKNITDKVGWISSVYPCTEYLTFGPWIYMVPQYVPKDVLMLGYAGGTTAGLIRLFYGTVPITAVDIIDMEIDYDVDFYKENAETFVMNSNRKWDSIIIDIYDNKIETEPFVTQSHFVTKIKEMANYVIVHVQHDTDMQEWGKPMKVLELNQSKFYYYMVNRIATLPIR